MKKAKLLVIMYLLLICLSVTGCRRSTDDVWEDTKSASRHVNRGFRTLGGKHGDSRQIRSRDEFYAADDGTIYQNDGPGNDFIPLADMPNQGEMGMSEAVSQQPRENPGDPGSSIPGIDAFHDPSTIPGLAGVFRNINFEYNSNLVKGQQNLETIRSVADYMKQHPNTYAFVEGHCDERGPEAFNYSLGSRRSNAVRNMLLSEGVNPDNIFTISYGKDRPLIHESHEEAWGQNRRAEFKVYQR
jgi:peptidoglycan-associated lipoprotein